MKRKSLFLRALAIGFCFTLLLQAVVLAEQCGEIRENVLRFHVIAQSDSARDQLIKLRVRDAVLNESRGILDGVRSRKDAVSAVKKQLPRLQKAAEAELLRIGVRQQVTCQVTDCYFPTRVYDKVTLPAGRYTAFRVVLGSGKGHNWWCVMFPCLCLPAAEKDVTLSSVLSSGSERLVQTDSVNVKFKTVELAGTLIETCRSWFASPNR